MSSNLDPAKLKVADLRNELSARGLDVKGTKPVLVKRLKDALEKESDKEIPDTSIVDTSTEEADEPPAPKKSLRGSVDEREEARATRGAPTVTPPSPEKPKQVVKTPEKAPQEKIKPVASAPVVKTPVKVPEQPKPVVKTPEQPKPVVKTAEQPKPVVKTPEQSRPVVKTPEKPKTPAKLPEKPNVEVKSPEKPQTQAKLPEKPKAPEGKGKVDVDSAAKKAKLEQENGEQETKMDVQEESEKASGEEGKPGEKGSEQKGEKRKRSSDSPERTHKRAKSPVKEDEPEINAESVQLSWFDSDLQLQVDKTTFLSAKPLTDGAFGYVWAGARATHGVSTGKVCYEVKVSEKLKWSNQPRPGRDNRDNRDAKYKTDHRKGRRDDKRNQKSSESAKSDSEKAKDSSEKKAETVENKEDAAKVPESNDNKSETTEKAEENAAKADEPMDTTESVEKKVEENGDKDDDKEKKEDDKEKKEDGKDKEDDKDKADDKDKDDDKDKKEKVEEPPLPTHFIRIGWSVASASLQLGEDKLSYSYESSGKAVKEKEFADYGITFDAGDVVGAFLDISATTVTLHFTVNGNVQPSLQIPKADLPENFVLYPHILTRNYAFEVNFGEKEEPWFAIPSELSGYQFISKVENKVVGRVRPENRSDCEVILMCGLPASGKTEWVKEHVTSNLDKHYTVLGTAGLLERMTISGEALKPKYKGRWSYLVDMLSKSLNRLVSMAALRRRNYIIDQTNVFPSAQRRKMRPFEGFKRKAVIVVNGDEEQARRQALQEALEGKEVPDSTLLEMKAAMVLPEVGDWLEEIEYVGATEEEVKEIIKKYNAAGKAAGYGTERRFPKDRWNYNRRNDYRGGRNFQRQGSGGYNRQPYSQNRWGGAPRQSSGGGGGWKQDSRSRDWRSGSGSGGGGYERRDRDYYSQSGYGGRSQQQSGGRSQGGSGQRWGGSSGGWSGQGSGGSGGGWNQQTFGGSGGGGRSYGQGWGGQSSGGQGGWGGKYGSGGSGQGQGGYGGGYNNWNYYGQQQQQNWSGQGQQQRQQQHQQQHYYQQAQPGYATSQAQMQGQYSQAYSTQEAWAQYAKQYAQHQQVAQNQAAAAAVQKR